MVALDESCNDFEILYIKICSKYAPKDVFDTSKKKENKIFCERHIV